MLSAIEEIMRFHPAYQFGQWERRQSDVVAFQDLERRSVRRRHEYEAKGNERTWMLGEVAAATAIVVVFCAVLSVIAQLAGESANTGEQSVAAASDGTAPD